jgi:hypothetical protein
MSAYPSRSGEAGQICGDDFRSQPVAGIHSAKVSPTFAARGAAHA